MCDNPASIARYCCGGKLSFSNSGKNVKWLVVLHSNEENREHRKHLWNAHCAPTNHMRDPATAENEWAPQSRNEFGSQSAPKDQDLRVTFI